MKYKKYKMKNFNLYTIETDRFKTINIQINIRLEDKKEYNKYIRILPELLLNTSSKYNTLKEINKACADIYDPFYNVSILNSGRQLVLSLSGDFINEKYTKKGMNKKSIQFLTEVLFSPKINNNCFDEKMFNIKKNKIIENISSIKDRPRSYASIRINEEMKTKEYDEYKLDELLNHLTNLQNNEVFDFYNKFLTEGKLDVFVCGNFNSDEIKNIIDETIVFNGNYEIKPNHIIKQTEYNKKPNIVLEPSNNIQSNLIIGCKMLGLTEFERKYVSVLYAWILGGGTNSLLNQTVREKNSLCYYIYAIRNSLFETMNIYAGINANDFEKTYKLVEEETKNIKNGNIKDELIESVKNIYHSSLITIDDNVSDVVNNFISEIYVGNDDIETRNIMIDKVSKEDIINFSKKIHIDTVYLLKGDKE